MWVRFVRFARCNSRGQCCWFVGIAYRKIRPSITTRFETGACYDMEEDMAVKLSAEIGGDLLLELHDLKLRSS